MLWRNGEHYPDPTAGAAFQRIAREEARNEMNEGKRFEHDFQASVPPDEPLTPEEKEAHP